METARYLFDCLCAGAFLGTAVLAAHYRRRLAAVSLSLQASELAGEELCRDVDGLRSVASMLEKCNYRMACELHGKAAVDKAIRDAHDGGGN
jgi:hypothetical protein